MNATQFVIPAGGAEFVVNFRVDPDGPSKITGETTQEHLVAGNAADMVGTLDLDAGTISLDIDFGDSSQGFEGTFTANLTVAPVDTDGDGIFDALDNCPLVPNPDQTDEPPVFEEVAEQTIEICSPGDEIVFEPPTASDTCTPDEVDVEGVVLELNGVELDPPVFLADNRAVLPSGTFVVEWTATDGNDNATAVTQVVQVLTQPTLFATGTVQVADRAEIVAPGGQFGTIDNAGAGEVNIGVQAQTGDVLSGGRVFLRDNGSIQGFVKTGDEFVPQNPENFFVGGTIEQGIAVVLPEEPVLDVSFPAPTESFDLQPGDALPLDPGSYGSVAIKSGATLSLTTGTYYITSLDAEPGAVVILDKSMGEIEIFVEQSLIYRGEFVHSSGDGSDFLLGFVGTSGAFLEAPFQGTVVAPNTRLTLGAGAALDFTGQFFAGEIEVRPDVVVHHDAFDCEQVIEPTPTCDDGLLNGNETDVDCGGSCGATCPDGMMCMLNSDCVSASCSVGTCVPPGDPSACSEATATDLGSDGNNVRVDNNACIRVRDAYPAWWGVRSMQLQVTSDGTYPVPFTWENACTGAGGSGIFTGDWQGQTFGPTDAACATVIDLLGAGDGTIEVRYYG